MSTLPIPSVPEAAVSAGDDPRHYAQVLSAVYDAAMSGGKLPARPRAVISDSWHRALHAGVDPESDAAGVALPISDVAARRQDSGLGAVLGVLTRGLDTVIADGDNILVVADAHGSVLWRSGAPRVLHHADRLGFVEGADWAERAVGTNAIGTALMSGRAVQVFSAEHFVRSHHSWTCAGAPIRDPRTGRLLGVIDVSGPADTIHPTTVALVDVVAKLAESQLRDHHRQTLDQLRAVAAPMLARVGGAAVAVDTDGWVAALDEVSVGARVPLPRSVVPGRMWLNGLGDCDIDPLPGGWLIRVVDDQTSSGTTSVVIDLRDPARPTVQVCSATGRWTRHPSPRHAQILQVLARHREGRSAAQLSADLFGVADRTITVRAEMSRLRKHFGGVLGAGPYRFDDGVDVVVQLPLPV